MTISSRSLKFTAFLSAAFLALGLVAMLFVPKARAVTSFEDIESGDLIRGESLTAVYYMGADGFRYVFPNDKTYFTWYSDFDDVKWITDSDLAKIQLGGNVTYKAAVKMVKITSSPTVYFVGEDAELSAIDSEETAALMYENWNTKIDDVADAFFSNYTVTSDTITAETADVASGDITRSSSINEYKNLTAPEEIAIANSETEDGAFEPSSVTISAGETVRFKNNDSASHTVLADDNSWGSIIAADGMFVKRFATAGTYTYYNKDTDATGVIYVE